MRCNERLRLSRWLLPTSALPPSCSQRASSAVAELEVVRRLESVSVKATLLILLLASSLSAADPDTHKETKPYRSKFEAHEIELSGYSTSESPWKDNKGNSAFEWHLVSVMQVEAYLWGLQAYLPSQEEEAAGAADRASQLMHIEMLSDAEKALNMLRRNPNRPLTELLIHHLESYPYDWVEEGWEDLIPNLRRLIATPSGKPKRRK